LVSGTVFDIKKFSIHDGPGIRTTVFLKGCPLDCWWCHNPESQSVQPELMVRPQRCISCGACLVACTHGAISSQGDAIITDQDRCAVCGACVETCYAEAREMVGRTMTVNDVMAVIARDIPFYDESGGGATFSGGEPLLQPAFLLALLQECRAQEIHTALDTCGFASWTTLERIRPHVDLFLYDLKLMDEERHRQFTGVSNTPILRNLVKLSENGHEIIIRFPLVPGFNDDHDNIRKLAAFIARLPGPVQVDVLPYHHTAADKYQRLNRHYALSNTRPPDEEAVTEIRRMLEAEDLTVKIGG
jgi:pyruvate formate lyase activating enzyme